MNECVCMLVVLGSKFTFSKECCHVTHETRCPEDVNESRLQRSCDLLLCSCSAGEQTERGGRSDDEDPDGVFR